MFISLRLKNARFDDESLEGTNTRAPTIDFEQEAGRMESEEDEDEGLPPELERIIA